MLNKFRKSEKGFTLIELLIVVAIIGILAAVAIPQFAAYRQRAYNSAALADLRNAKTAEESLFAEIQAYGATDGAIAVLDAAVPAPAGAVNQGPMAGAMGGAVPVAGSRVAGTNAQGAQSAMAFGISNGVNLHAACSITGTNNAWDSYVVAARHEMGDTAYAADSDNTTTVYRVSNPAWINVPNIISAAEPGPVVAQDNLNGFAGGGSPTANWTLM